MKLRAPEQKCSYLLFWAGDYALDLMLYNTWSLTIDQKKQDINEYRKCFEEHIISKATDAVTAIKEERHWGWYGGHRNSATSTKNIVPSTHTTNPSCHYPPRLQRLLISALKYDVTVNYGAPSRYKNTKH